MPAALPKWMPTPEALDAELLRRGIVIPERPLWPAPFNVNTPEAAWLFCLQCRTWNEAEREVQAMPDLAYLRLYADRWWRCRQEGRMLVTLKCRRMVVSWVDRALTLWAMGMSRMDATLVGEDLEAAAKHVWRLEFLYDDLKKQHPGWRLPERSHLLYEGEKKLKQFSLPNGSQTTYANGQASGLQGDGTAMITLEEPAQYRYLAAMVAQAKIITQGSAKVAMEGERARRGMVNLISNARQNYDWQMIRAIPGTNPPQLVPLKPTECKGVEEIMLPTGALHLKIHHYADPSKDAAWLEALRLEMSDTPDDFRREILMDETVQGGQPVYTTYNDAIHAPKRWMQKRSIPVIPGSIYFGGWDAGATMIPAFVLLQVTLPTFQVHVLFEVVSEGGESMDDFAPRVQAAIMDRLPGQWDEVRHFGDYTIGSRLGNVGTTAKEVAHRHGIDITLVSNTWAPRMSAVSWLLKRECDEQPGFIIEAMSCPVLLAGFRGSYRLKISASGDQRGPGVVALEPIKNSFSHVADALQYPCVAIREMVEGFGGAKMLD